MFMGTHGLVMAMGHLSDALMDNVRAHDENS